MTLNRSDYEDLACALSAAAERVEREAGPGGVLESLDPAQAMQVVALVASTMADDFSGRHLVFDRATFLDTAGLLDAVAALGITEPAQRREGSPIAFDDVRTGDELHFISSGGGQYIGIVDSKTDKTVRIAEGFRDLETGVAMVSTTALRRANWDRLHVHLVQGSA